MEYLALYLRLSLEDESETGESNSIANQRKQIYEYIHQNPELFIYETIEFCDDGYSGTNMERPGMKKLLHEIKANN
ncbi:MAG: recombinase family protein, partial [Coprococcus sp.]